MTKNLNQQKFFAFSFQHLVKLKLQVVGPYGLCNFCQSLCHTRTFVSSRLSRVTRINTLSSQQGSAVWAKEQVKLKVVGPAHGLHASCHGPARVQPTPFEVTFWEALPQAQSKSSNISFAKF